CLRVGYGWSLEMLHCGFCGAPLPRAEAASWRPTFPYPADEALAYARLLLTEVRGQVERRLDQRLRQQDGWLVEAGVPVHWQQGTRGRFLSMLREAFPEAGLELLDEPEAALRYY